jgi:RsiW-degrading membrane proteinase PrsW (M82 family)
MSPNAGKFETKFCEKVPGAVGFTFLETPLTVRSHVIQNVIPKAAPDAGQLVGLQLLIPRILGTAAAEMTDSGYWGYFIGLSGLKPRSRWPILGPGYFSEVTLHALSNASEVEGRIFRGVAGSFVIYVFGSRDLTEPELCLRIERKMLPLE